MKSKIDILLPVALSLVLPGLNFLANSGVNDFSIELYKRWLFASAILYVLWYSLLYVSSLRVKYKNLFIVLSILFFTVTIYLLFTFLFFQVTNHIKWVFIVKFILASILFLMIQYALRASKNIAEIKLENQQMQTENYRVQLEALRNKVDPHFLFNSLNTLRSMVHQKHPNAEKFVLNLSDFYRNTLKYNDNTIITLADELAFLESYLFLMKCRNEESIVTNIYLEERHKKYFLPTLALQTVVENCFKHNAMTSKMPLEIKVYLLSNEYIAVQNNIQPKLDATISTGYGLESLKKRYELIGIKDGVIYNENGGTFIVKLKLIEKK